MVRHVLQVSMTQSLMAPSVDDVTSNSCLMMLWNTREENHRKPGNQATTLSYATSGIDDIQDYNNYSNTACTVL